MRKAAFVLTAVLFLAIAVPVFAQEFPDVPADHWAYQAVQELLNAGIIQGYPDGTFAGKRAMTRYEFAEAVAKAIPVIESKLGQAQQGPVGPTGPQGPAGPPPAVTAEQLAALQKLVDEFREELASLGVDVEALRRDIAALNDRVTALEAEVARVKLTGVADVAGRGEVRNFDGPAFDVDSRALAFGASADDRGNPLANSQVFSNYGFGVKAKSGSNANVVALVNAGNYMNFALSRGDSNIGLIEPLQDFLLWNLYADAPIRLGPLGTAEVVAGRHPFQLTPFTLKLVDPDSYVVVPVLDNGDYLFDGARATFNLGRAAVTTFASKVTDIGSGADNLLHANLQFAGGLEGIQIEQLAGARVVIGTPMSGNLGLTYYQAGLSPFVGRTSVYGADMKANVGNIGVAGEYAKMAPNDQFESVFLGSGADNFAWNAKLSYAAGRLGLGAGYILVKQNYMAPGYWMRVGRAVNLQNVKGATANVKYDLGRKLSISAEGQFLQPDQGTAVTGRTTVEQGPAVSTANLDSLTYWKAGLKYGLSAANSLDIGWEEGTWESTLSGAQATKERYVTLGIGHSINPNSSLKLLYQIQDFKAGALDPYHNQNTSYRGGLAAAQFEMKY